MVPGVDGTASIGALDVGLGGTLQVTDRDTVYDLYGPATTIGASGGPLWYVGADVVSFSDVTASNAEINGFQLTGGIGYGVDVHVVESYTRPVGNRGIVQHMGKGVLPNKTVYSSLCE